MPIADITLSCFGTNYWFYIACLLSASMALKKEFSDLSYTFVFCENLYFKLKIEIIIEHLKIIMQNNGQALIFL